MKASHHSDNQTTAENVQEAGRGSPLPRLVRCFVCRSNHARPREAWEGDETIQKHGIWIECEHCESRGPRCGTIEDAVTEWNATTGIHRAAASFLEASTLLNISPHDWPTQRYYQRRKKELQNELESVTANEGCENAEHPTPNAES
jgi:hypothetical protein